MDHTPRMPRRGWRWLAWHVVGRHGRAEACRRLAQLEATQWSSRTELEAAARAALSAQLEHVCATVPYYRGTSSRSGLNGFPILERQSLQRSFESLRSAAVDPQQVWTLSSSGSSGLVIRVLRDQTTQAWATAATWRGDCWGADLSPLHRQVSVLSNVGNVMGSRRALSPVGSWLHNRYTLDAMKLDATEARRLLAQIAALKPRILTGYPSVLHLLARFGLELGLKAPPLSKVLPTAETCSQAEADLMEQFFRVPVRQRYGSHEFSAMAHQCERGTWHWHQELLKVEVRCSDGSIADNGTGSLLCTSLVNRSMPLVRYEIGDQLDLTPVACDCGRGLATFSSIEGRALEYVYCPGGRWISSHAFLAPLRSLPLLGFQLLQEEPGRIVLRLLAAPGFEDQHMKRIGQIYDQIHEGELQVDVRLVDELERAASGKVLRMINRLTRPLAGT